jgi:5-hydroxyisourate hydrolase-like protein (transthyretin family)
MGMPLDVIIKDFRDSNYCKNFDHVFDAAEAFFDFLATEFKILGEDEDDHIKILCSHYIPA